MKKMRALPIALLIGLLLSGLPTRSAAQTAPYFSSGTSPTATLGFSALGGRFSTCTFAINPVGGGSYDLNGGVLSTFDTTGNGGQRLGVVFYTPKGYVVGTDTGTVLVTNIYWFPCSGATSVSLHITASGTFTYAFIASSQSWPFQQLQGSAGAMYPPTIADTVVNVNITTPATTTQIVAGNTNQPTILYSITGVGSGPNTAATGKAIYGGGATCGTSTVTLTPQPVTETGAAGAVVTQLWPPPSTGATIPFVIPPGNNVCIVSGGTAFSIFYTATIAQPQ